MFRRLLPTETSFFDFFDQHIKLTVEATKEFLAFVSKARPTSAGISPTAKRIKELEHEADVITHRCVAALHKTFITPFDRDSIHRLIRNLDDVMDLIDSAVERINLYELEEMKPPVKDMADVLVRAVEVLVHALEEMHDMKNVDAIQTRCVEVHRLENEGDAIVSAALARLFKEEKDPIAIIKWKEIYEQLEEATDRCEDVANLIEGVVLESA
jgi:uncharacterized protein